jgi:hypothetical protein
MISAEDKAAADKLLAEAPPLPPRVIEHLDTAIGPAIRAALKRQAAATPDRAATAP